jgi:hypothetical protein
MAAPAMGLTPWPVACMNCCPLKLSNWGITMKRFKNIVLHYESDHATLDRSAALAFDNRARLTVVQVVRDMPERWRNAHVGNTQIDLQQLAIQQCESTLKQSVTTGRAGSMRKAPKRGR